MAQYQGNAHPSHHQGVSVLRIRNQGFETQYMTLVDALTVPPEDPDDSDEEIEAEEADDARRTCFQQNITAIYDVSHAAEK